MHPVAQLLTWFPDCDFAILEHGLAPHGRDYQLVVEHSGFDQPGRHRLTLTHVVELTVTTAVRDDVWPRSWDDLFTDYAAWERAGHPDGYVWGTNWSLAYPGWTVVEPSATAARWTERLGHPMFEARVETDRFQLQCCFHALRTEFLDDRTEMVSRVIIPLDNPSGGAA